MNATSRFVELIDGRTILQIGGWRQSRAGFALLKRFARDPAGYPDELLAALHTGHLRRVKINVAREVTRRSVQLRNGPLLTVLYSLLGVVIAVTTTFLAITSTGPPQPSVVSFLTILGVGFVGLLILALATGWTSTYLTLLDALDDCLNRRPPRQSRWLKRHPARL